MALVEIKNLTFKYPERAEAALKSINLSVNEGEFILLCGKSGCGKSSLLRQLKPALTPYGTKSGEILFDGKPIASLSAEALSSEIGFVPQNPDSGIVTDKVWHELAFGLENIGTPQNELRLRVAETASFFGIEGFFLQDVNTLSGGQKQLVNLAAVTVMQPKLLVLDEPTSQLDPIAAADFIEALVKLNREIGTTVIIAEHRLDNILPLADRCFVLEKGEIMLNGSPLEIGNRLKSAEHSMFLSMPAPMRIYSQLESDLPCPLTVREGRKWLDSTLSGKPIVSDEIADLPLPAEKAVEMKNVWFSYGRNSRDILKDMSMVAYKGEIYSILGGNGAGKTTVLSIISGLNRPYRGKVKLNGLKTALLPQNPASLFVKEKIGDDLKEIAALNKRTDEELSAAAETAEISGLLDSHPYDLSGGEQQRAALGMLLLLMPDVLLLDEPTKGMDNHFKAKLGRLLQKLKADGMTIIIVSHDIEFCAQFADRCGLFYGGEIVSQSAASRFFVGNSFYTTAANRMSRHLFKNAVTVEDVVELCKKNKL